MSYRFSFVFYIVVVIAGFCALLWSAFKVYEAWVSSSWPHTAGIIQESRIESSSSSGPHGGGISFRPIITYAFTVNGRSHVNSKIDDSLFWSAQSSRQIVDAFPIGSQKSVYYCPTNPDDSVIVTGLHPRSFQTLVLSFLIISVAILFGVVAYLAPKFGKKQSDGSYFFDASSPVTKYGFIGLGVIACQFILLWCLR